MVDALNEIFASRNQFLVTSPPCDYLQYLIRPDNSAHAPLADRFLEILYLFLVQVMKYHLK